MRVPRETIFAALLTKAQTAVLNGNPAFVTSSRKFRSWDEVNPVEMPALFIASGNQNAMQQAQYGDIKWRIRALAWIYCMHSPDSETIPGTDLNYLLDAFEEALKPTVPGRQTLGGLVTHAYIDGEIMISEGSLPNDTKSVALIPITIDLGV